MLCGGPALQLFSATELERLVCGNPFLDFDNLQKSARYEGGYSPGGWVGAATGCFKVVPGAEGVHCSLP